MGIMVYSLLWAMQDLNLHDAWTLLGWVKVRFCGSGMMSGRLRDGHFST